MLFLCISILLFTVNNFLWKYIVSLIPPVEAACFRSVVSSGVFVMIAVCTDIPLLSANHLPEAACYCFVGAVGLLIWLTALKQLMLSYVVIATLFSQIFTISIGLLVFNEQFTLNKGIATVCIAAGYWICTKQSKKEELNYKAIGYVIIACICYGIAYAGTKKLTNELSAVQLATVQECTVLLLTSMLLVRKGNFQFNPSWNFQLIITICAMGLIVAGALFSGIKALSILPLSTLANINSTGPVWILLGAFVFFKEKLTIRQVIGCGIMLTGSYFSL